MLTIIGVTPKNFSGPVTVNPSSLLTALYMLADVKNARMRPSSSLITLTSDGLIDAPVVVTFGKRVPDSMVRARPSGEIALLIVLPAPISNRQRPSRN